MRRALSNLHVGMRSSGQLLVELGFCRPICQCGSIRRWAGRISQTVRAVPVEQEGQAAYKRHGRTRAGGVIAASVHSGRARKTRLGRQTFPKLV